MRRMEIEKEVIAKYKTPLRDMVLLLLDEVPLEVVSTGGIVIRNDIANQSMERVGTVVSVGKNVLELEVGNRVLMNKSYGRHVQYEHSNTCPLLILSDDQVEAVLTGEAEREDYDYHAHGLN